MDASRFDDLARALAIGTSRRRFLTGLAGAALAVVPLRRAGAACREAGRRCTQDGNCCSGLCDPAGRTCVCPPGQESCRGACTTAPTDYLGDVDNCGACGNRCPVDQCTRATCVQGVCELEPIPERIGQSCDDSTCCTENDLCQADGACRGTPITCRAPEACEEPGTGVCNPATCQCDFTLRPPSYVCREATGDCDVAETCTGDAPDCPPDVFRPNTTVCRPAADDCDMAETCTGSSPHCPPDVLRPAGFACRPATDDCDAEETCNGVSPACPTDRLKAQGIPCRAAAGNCETAAVCTGASAECPPNLPMLEGAECRASTGTCDPAEVCDGRSLDCPPDVIQEVCGLHDNICCAPGQRCTVDRDCGTCGGEGEICCRQTPSSPLTCGADLVCVAGTSPNPRFFCVQRCGGPGEPCCLENPDCAGGLTCDSHSQTCVGCGGEGQQCCATSDAFTCGDGRFCAQLYADSSVPPVCVDRCGDIDEPCCANVTRCREGARCLSEGPVGAATLACRACGGVGEHCCPDPTCNIADCFETFDRCCPGVCDDPTRTYCRDQLAGSGGQDGICVDCGREGEFCCFYGDRPLCDGDMECLDGSTCGSGCGALGEQCCRNEIEGASCDHEPDPIVCDGTTHTCVYCGSLGELCCDGNICDSGIGCEEGTFGTCVNTCGGLHERCCAAPNRCLGDQTCFLYFDDGGAQRSTCEECGALGEPCCFGSQHEQPCDGDLLCRWDFALFETSTFCVVPSECGGEGQNACIDRDRILFCDPGLVVSGDNCRRP